MSKKPTILVTSAAGKTGMPTTLQLLEKGHPVRAFVRRADHRAKRLADAGAEIFVGDHFALPDMRSAMAGVGRAYFCAPAAPGGLLFSHVFATAAQEARLEHVVMLSQWLAHADHPSFFTRETWLTEQMFKRLPETSLTINNVGWFADNYFMVLESAAQFGLLTMPLGDGNVKKDAPPSNEDIARVSVAALIDPGAHAGKTYRPTGPTLLSPNEIAATLGKVLERKVRYWDVPDSMVLKAFTAEGYSPALQSQFVGYYTEEYRRGSFAVGAPSGAVEAVTGRAPEDFETIARRYAASRPEARRTAAARLRAMRNFARLLATRSATPAKVERLREHALLTRPEFSFDSAAWRKTHDPAAGFTPDRPNLDDRVAVVEATAPA